MVLAADYSVNVPTVPRATTLMDAARVRPDGVETTATDRVLLDSSVRTAAVFARATTGLGATT